MYYENGISLDFHGYFIAGGILQQIFIAANFILMCTLINYHKINIAS